MGTETNFCGGDGRFGSEIKWHHHPPNGKKMRRRKTEGRRRLLPRREAIGVGRRLRNAAVPPLEAAAGLAPPPAVAPAPPVVRGRLAPAGPAPPALAPPPPHPAPPPRLAPAGGVMTTDDALVPRPKPGRKELIRSEKRGRKAHPLNPPKFTSD